MTTPLRAVAAEAFGTAALLVAVVGSGIVAAAQSPRSEAIALLANAFATALALYVLITILAPVSGAHLEPVVSVTAWLRRDVRARPRAHEAWPPRMILRNRRSARDMRKRGRVR